MTAKKEKSPQGLRQQKQRKLGGDIKPSCTIMGTGMGSQKTVAS